MNDLGKITTTKKAYSKPVFEEIIIDNEISLIMLSPGSDPGGSSGGGGGNDW